MFGSATLEVAIGIIVLYILVSLLCSGLREGIEAWLKTRSSYLEFGIRELLHDRSGGKLAGALFNHPLIYGLFPDGYKPRTSTRRPGPFTRGANLPSYIPSRNFALALMDIAARGPDTKGADVSGNAPVISLDSMRQNVACIGNPGVQRVLLNAIDTAQGDLNRAQANIEAWYDSSMDRISGWYKRSTQKIILFLGLTIAIVLNINTFTIADYLLRHDAARAYAVKMGEGMVQKGAPPSGDFQAVENQIDEMQLPIGWERGISSIKRIGRDSQEKTGKASQEPGPGLNDWILAIFGWLLTAMAASLGAPFWFDVLNKVMVIRSTVKPHEKSPEEASEDRQRNTPAPAPLPAIPPGLGQAGPNPPPPNGSGAAVDECCIPAGLETPDDELPQAEGGVEK